MSANCEHLWETHRDRGHDTVVCRRCCRALSTSAMLDAYIERDEWKRRALAAEKLLSEVTYQFGPFTFVSDP